MPTITSFEGARIIFTNFRGESHPKYNARGARSFHIALEDPDLAQELVEEGYNVRFLNQTMKLTQRKTAVFLL